MDAVSHVNSCVEKDVLILLLADERQPGKNCLTVLVTATDLLPAHHPMSFLIHVAPRESSGPEWLLVILLYQ